MAAKAPVHSLQPELAKCETYAQMLEVLATDPAINKTKVDNVRRFYRDGGEFATNDLLVVAKDGERIQVWYRFQGTLLADVPCRTITG
jgi:hypothetical protein